MDLNRGAAGQRVTCGRSVAAPRVDVQRGVDSSAALVELGDRVDWLIHVSNFENLESQMTEQLLADELASTRAVAEARGLGWMHLRTNFPAVFKHNRFDDHFPPGCSFWLGLEHVQHIATALAVMRPRLERVYLAGGFSELLRRTGELRGVRGFRQPVRGAHAVVPG